MASVRNGKQAEEGEQKVHGLQLEGCKGCPVCVVMFGLDKSVNLTEIEKSRIFIEVEDDELRGSVRD